MIRFIFLAALLFISIATTAQEKFGTDVTKKDGVKASSLLLEAIENKKSIGIAAGFSVVAGKKWSDAKGFSDLDKKINFSADTRTRIGSVTKPITAVAIMQLVEKGLLKLEQPISEILPKEITKDKGFITVKQLLGHSSGIAGYTSNKERENAKEYTSLKDAAAHFIDRKLLFEPGTNFSYSSYAYTLLGLIIEELSGQSFEAYVQINIFDKVGMIHSGFEKIGINYPNKSKLYHKNHRGKIKQANPTNLSDRIPAGGIYSNTNDVLKFGDAVLNGTLIQPETLKIMSKNSGLKKEGSGYGLGFYLYGKNANYGDVIGHTGGQTGCSSFLFLLPEVKTTIIVLSNTSGALQEVSNIAVKLFDISQSE